MKNNMENNMKNGKEIILASGSPRRKELLSQIGLKFQVMTSDADETFSMTDPGEIVKELSLRKASAVRMMIQEHEMKPQTEKQNIVIGADTIVYSKGEILGKPKDKTDAKRMIKALSGNIHQVYTGVSVLSDKKKIQFYEKTDVYVYAMSEQEIEDYVATGEPFDKAGAYGIQGAFGAFVKKIDGDYNNVVGLPAARLYHELGKADLL